MTDRVVPTTRRGVQLCNPVEVVGSLTVHIYLLLSYHDHSHHWPHVLTREKSAVHLSLLFICTW